MEDINRFSDETGSPSLLTMRSKFRARRAFTTTAFAILVYQLLTFAISFAVILLIDFTGFAASAFYAKYEGILDLLLLTALPLYAAGYPLLCLFFRRNPQRVPEKQMRFGPGKFFLCFCIALMFSIAGSLIGQGILALFESLTGIQVGSPLQETLDSIPVWAEILFACVLAPVFEELVYRKFVLDRVGRYGEGTAIVFSAVIFGGIHGNFEQLFYAAFLGLLLGYIYMKTGKIVYTICLHAAFNFWGSVVAQWVQQALDKIPEVSEGYEEIMDPDVLIASLIVELYSLLEYGMIIAGLVLFIVFLCKKKCRLNRSSLPGLTPGKGVCAAWLNVGTLLLLLFILVTLALSIYPLDMILGL